MGKLLLDIKKRNCQLGKLVIALIVSKSKSISYRTRYKICLNKLRTRTCSVSCDRKYSFKIACFTSESCSLRAAEKGEVIQVGDSLSPVVLYACSWRRQVVFQFWFPSCYLRVRFIFNTDTYFWGEYFLFLYSFWRLSGPRLPLSE